MKFTLLLASLVFAAGLASAETTITLSGVHNCCKGCTNGITKAAAGIKDVTVTAEGKTVTVTAKSKANAKKAVEAIMAAGAKLMCFAPTAAKRQILTMRAK